MPPSSRENIQGMGNCVLLQRLNGEESACDAGGSGDEGSIPGSGRSPELGNDNPLQYSCLENPMDREAWKATVYGAAKNPTGLSARTMAHPS